ncbi:MAG: hypothetical protein K2N73_12260 [Lachnospiraceae bacterium]|nr:hypothetical protein [Lachnospiraceae bacterium]
MSGKKDDRMPKADIAADCAVWEKRYGRENTLPAELLADLQDYVANRYYIGALAAYRDESLLCTREELQRACPEYKMLMEQSFVGSGYGREALDEDRIYCLDRNAKMSFLLFTNIFYDDAVRIGTLLLEDEESGWTVKRSNASHGNVGRFEIFSREENGEKQYYVLWAGSDRLGISRLSNLPDGVFPSRETVRSIQTGVVSDTLYRKRFSGIASQVEDYVQENLELFVWRYQEEKNIWGDEELTQLPEEAFRADRYDSYVFADYDNDGEKELFYRDMEMIEQMDKVDGKYQVTTVDMLDNSDSIDMKRIWFTDFDGKIVTFQLLEPEPSELMIKAFLYEDGRAVDLYSCRIGFEQKAGVVHYTLAYWEAFDFNGVAVRETEDIWLRPQVQEQVQREQENRTIVPCKDEDVPFPKGLLLLLREQAHAGLYGRKNEYPEPYRVDLSKDTELFLKRMQSHLRRDEDYWKCKWAYHWTASDGSENFISCINYSWESDSIEWWKLVAGEVQDHAYITETETDSQLIDYEGQLYCVTDFGRTYGSLGGDSVEMEVIEMNRLEDWRYTWFVIHSTASDSQDFSCIPLYEEEGLCPEIKDYIDGCCENVGESCAKAGIEIFSRSGETEYTKAQERVLKNLADGSVTGSPYAYYFAADIDNDGTMEYAAASWLRGWMVTFYENEDGNFCVIPIENITAVSPGEQEAPAETANLSQMWCKELGGTTYLFTVENLWDSPDLVLRVRMLKGDVMVDKAIYLLKANMAESCSPWSEMAVEPDEAVG